MKIALIGASGGVGREVLAEALRRNHAVVAICRHPDRLEAQPHLDRRAVDLFAPGALQAAIEGCDAVISCFNVGHAPDATRNIYKDTLEGAVRIIKAVKTSTCRRLLFVGGAASLYVAPNLQLLDMPGYPFSVMDKMPSSFLQWLATQPMPSFMQDTTDQATPVSMEGPDYVPAFVRVRMLLEHDTSFDWSFFSPPPAMIPGERTGHYRRGGNQVPMQGDHFAGISYADAAVALVDELEMPRQTRSHWTACSASM